MNTYSYKFLLFLSVYLFNQILPAQEYKLSLEERPLYRAKKTNNKIVIDGKMDEEVWKKSEARTLDYHYLTQTLTDKQKTTFRMLWDDETIYLFYQSEDKYLTANEKNRDGKPYLDDCAEIFFIPVPNSLNMHFCFEINLYKAKNDLVFINNYYDNENAAIKAYNPDYKVEVTTNGTINNNSDIDKGWTMELAIPINAFKGSTNLHPLKKGAKWAFLALRQSRNELKIGRRCMSSIFPIDNIEEDVHQPNMFGLVEFTE